MMYPKIGNRTWPPFEEWRYRRGFRSSHPDLTMRLLIFESQFGAARCLDNEVGGRW